MTIKRQFLLKMAKAEAVFQAACERQRSADGYAAKRAAVGLHAKAAALGSVKALLHIGLMLRDNPGLLGDPKKGVRHMMRVFSRAGKKGCPEGFYRLYEEFSEGVRVRKRPGAAERYLHKAAREGSAQALVILGKRAVSDGDLTWGRHLLEDALDRGCADACFYLALYHATVSRQSTLVLHYLREGGRMGSVKCLHKLIEIYSSGKYGAMPNHQYALELADLAEKSDPRLPSPIRDFKTRFPMMCKWTGAAM